MLKISVSDYSMGTRRLSINGIQIIRQRIRTQNSVHIYHHQKLFSKKIISAVTNRLFSGIDNS